jgi:hypothetical protein
MIFVAGRASMSFEKLKVTPVLKGWDTAFFREDLSVENSNPVMGQLSFLVPTRLS